MLRRASMAPLLGSLLVLVGLLPLAGCGEGDAPHDSLLDPSVSLPVAARHGSTPPAAERITIALNAAGAVHVGDEACTLAELPSVLRRVLGVAPRSRLRVSIEENLEEVEEDTEEVDEQEIVIEEPVIIDDEPFTAEERLEELEEAEDDGGPIDFRAADLQRLNPKREVVELPPRDPGPREEARRDDRLTRPLDVLLQIDERVPYILAQQVLMACAEIDISLKRTFVAVRSTREDERGAMAIFLPVDGGLCGGRIVVGTDVTVMLRTPRKGDRPLATMGELAAALGRRREQPEDALFLELRASALTRWGLIVQVADQALAAGAYSLTFRGLPLPRRAVSTATWLARADAASPPILVLREPALEAHAPLAPEPPGARGGYFGFSNEVTMGEPVIAEEDVDEVLEDFDEILGGGAGK